jgi:hypothetical protein
MGIWQLEMTSFWLLVIDNTDCRPILRAHNVGLFGLLEPKNVSSKLHPLQAFSTGLGSINFHCLVGKKKSRPSWTFNWLHINPLQ